MGQASRQRVVLGRGLTVEFSTLDDVVLLTDRLPAQVALENLANSCGVPCLRTEGRP